MAEPLAKHSVRVNSEIPNVCKRGVAMPNAGVYKATPRHSHTISAVRSPAPHCHRLPQTNNLERPKTCLTLGYQQGKKQAYTNVLQLPLILK